MNPEKRRAIFARLREANPEPKSELEYSTPFELLVAVVLSAQATDRGVNLATRKLFPIANTPRAMQAHHWLRMPGGYVCKARRPECGRCAIVSLCEFRHQTQPPK